MDYVFTDELFHHGILGQKWGIRRYQPYPSGSKNGREIGEAARVSQRRSEFGTPASRKASAKQSQKNLKKEAKIEKKRLEEERKKS